MSFFVIGRLNVVLFRSLLGLGRHDLSLLHVYEICSGMYRYYIFLPVVSSWFIQSIAGFHPHVVSVLPMNLKGQLDHSCMRLHTGEFHQVGCPLTSERFAGATFNPKGILVN